MIACAFGPGRLVFRSGPVIASRASSFFFQRVPAGLSSSRMPRSASSLRMRSAAAKSRRCRAALRSSISRSISSTGTGGCASSARRRPITPEHPIELVDQRDHAAARRRRPICFSSIALLTSRTRSKIAASAAGRIQIALERLAKPRRAPCPRSPSSASGVVVRGRRPVVEPGEEIDDPAQRLLRLIHPGPGEVQLLAVVRRQQQVAQRRRTIAFRRGCRAGSRRCRATSTSSRSRRTDARRAPRSARTAASSRPRPARSRSRDAGRSDRCRRHECRSAPRRAGAAPSPSTRCASPDGRARRRHPTTAPRPSSPSTARSRGHRPSNTRRRRRGRRPACRRDRAAPACRNRGSVEILK